MRWWLGTFSISAGLADVRCYVCHWSRPGAHEMTEDDVDCRPEWFEPDRAEVEICAEGCLTTIMYENLAHMRGMWTLNWPHLSLSLLGIHTPFPVCTWGEFTHRAFPIAEGPSSQRRKSPTGDSYGVLAVYTRLCAERLVLEPKCEIAEPVAGIRHKRCVCNSDYCNASSLLRPNTSLIIITTVLLMLVYYSFCGGVQSSTRCSIFSH